MMEHSNHRAEYSKSMAFYEFARLRVILGPELNDFCFTIVSLLGITLIVPYSE